MAPVTWPSGVGMVTVAEEVTVTSVARDSRVCLRPMVDRERLMEAWPPDAWKSTFLFFTTRLYSFFIACNICAKNKISVVCTNRR